MTETLPVHVQAALKLYDRTLRLRFSKEKKRWLLERKCPQKIILQQFPPVEYYRDQDGNERERVLPENSDLMIQYRDGYVQICETGRPTMALIRELWQNDARRHGKKYAKVLAEKWAQAEAKKERERLGIMEDTAGEMYDSFAWRSGRRMAI